MPIRMLLAPWWIRMAYVSAVVIAFAFGGVWVARLDNPSMDLPSSGIALIVVGCLTLAALMTALSNQTRARYVSALEPVGTAHERAEAIRAARSSPTPENPRVREAAQRLALLYSQAPGRNRRLTIVGYVAMAILIPLNLSTALADDRPARAVLFAVAGVFLGWAVILERIRLRRARTRASALLNA
jgi:hypothetical protein